MIYKVGLLGASGRMGLEVAALLQSSHDLQLELADAVCKNRKFTAIEGIHVRTLSEPPRESVHVWIDFSQPVATLQLLNDLKTPIVVGTTGFKEEEIRTLRKASEKIALLFAPNMSRGIEMLRSALTHLAYAKADVWIDETHHERKLDAPSGTAKAILEWLKERGFDPRPIRSVRTGTIPGTHEIRMVLDGEELIFTHRAYQRTIFAQGAISAAKFLIGKRAGWYTMADVLK